ncbi:MAG: gamma carbonic anhydrase family protein [Syntrophomonadales bacterium]|jgi:phenylacetic acid degradation protein
MPMYEFEGKRPQIGVNCCIHPEAVLIGDIKIGDDCYIAACAVLRGDFGPIIIGDGSNIQENCVIHVQPGKSAVLGDRSHIGHGAILHSPRLGHHVTIGIGAIVLDDCEIGDESLIGAGSVVTSGTKIPAKSMVLGTPGKVVREITTQSIQFLNISTDVYQELNRRSITGLKLISE